jgi:transcriptional regulator with XRE-family HTH domain
MGIASLKNKVDKRIKIASNKKDYIDVGAFIKKRRKDLNLTQDVISSGICSISYLSKIENGQITPNDFFVKEIMNKLEIDDDVVKKTLEDTAQLEKAIKFIFYKNMDIYKYLVDELKEIQDNLTIDLIRFGYLVFTKNRISSEHFVRLENLIMNMSDLELQSYLLFTATFFMKEHDYKTALEILLLAEDLVHKNELVSALVNEQLYYVKQRLLKKNCSVRNFNEAYRIYNKYLNNERAIHIVLKKIHFLGLENPSLALEQLYTINGELLEGYNFDFYAMLKAEIYVKLELYNKAMMALKTIKKESTFYIKKMILMYDICIKENEYGYCEEIKSILKGCETEMKSVKDKIYYQYLLLEEDSKKDFLRDIAIPLSIKTSDFNSLKQYVDVIIDICIETSRYKEATQYYKKYQKEIKRVEKILYS